ncbi:MAG: hypothetical protein VW229_02305 [Pelagibacteraceae bacterium]|jgi:hypothetical protein
MKKIIIISLIAFLLGFGASYLLFPKETPIASNSIKNKNINEINEQEFESIIKKLFGFLNIMKKEMDNFDDPKNK